MKTQARMKIMILSYHNKRPFWRGAGANEGCIRSNRRSSCTFCYDTKFYIPVLSSFCRHWYRLFHRILDKLRLLTYAQFFFVNLVSPASSSPSCTYSVRVLAQLFPYAQIQRGTSVSIVLTFSQITSLDQKPKPRIYVYPWWREGLSMIEIFGQHLGLPAHYVRDNDDRHLNTSVQSNPAWNNHHAGLVSQKTYE